MEAKDQNKPSRGQRQDARQRRGSFSQMAEAGFKEGTSRYRAEPHALYMLADFFPARNWEPLCAFHPSLF